MCTSGNADILVVATSLGSLQVFDLKNIIDGNPQKNQALDYESLLSAQVKDWASLDNDKKQSYLNSCI